MRSFYRAMLDCRGVIYKKRDRAAADVYSSVERFLKEGHYSTYRKANELSTMRLSNYSEEAMAAQLGVNVGTVRTHTRNVSKELYQLFGTNFFDMLSNYADYRLKVDGVLYRVKHQGDMAVTYVLPDVVSAVKDQSSTSGSYSLNDCSQEIDFLRRYSRSFMFEALKEVDLGKLMYLLDILDGNKGSPDEWNTVISFVSGEVV